MTSPYLCVVKLHLSENKYSSERQFYTIFTLLGDLGGFNGAIIILPAYIMSKYSERMYAADVMKEIPVSDKKKGQKKNRENRQ